MSRSSGLERLVDRYVGIPILFLLSLWRVRRRLPVAPARIGIIQPTAIGDMFLISGLLTHLHQRWPDAELHMFHGLSNAAAVSMMPVDVVGHCCVFRRPWQVVRELRRARLDLLINCAPWTRLTAIATALSGDTATVGFMSAGQHIHYAYDVAVGYSADRHEVENHRALAERFGPLETYIVSARGADGPEPAGLAFERMVLLHMFAGGSRARQKAWPASHWVALATRLVEAGWIVGFTGAAADAAAVRRVLTAAQLAPERAICLAGRLSLPELAAAIRRAALLVTIDTGIAHLAAAVNGEVLALHGPTRFERWGASHRRAGGVNAPHPAAGYIHYGFETHPLGDEIMASLSVDIVFARALARLPAPNGVAPALNRHSG